MASVLVRLTYSADDVASIKVIDARDVTPEDAIELILDRVEHWDNLQIALAVARPPRAKKGAAR